MNGAMTEQVKAYGELEIGLDRGRTDAYQVELRFRNPTSELEPDPVKGDMRFEPQVLSGLELNPKAYGAALSSMLFKDDTVRATFARVRHVVDAIDLPLRVLLLVDATASELQGVRWELLTDPNSEAYLFTSERVLFSRFVTSGQWRSIRLRSKAEMNALVAVSAPSNLAEYGLASIELEPIGQARQNLEGFGVTVAGIDHPLTLPHLMDRIRERVDILYLVCHGGVKYDAPYMLLQAADGRVAPIEGRVFAERLGELSHPPLLAVLAMCESAGKDGLAGDGLAPMLAAAGIPAIVAMRGKISMETVKQIMPVFFRELAKDGQVDRAMAVARSIAVSHNRPDFWMPALYLRLRGGRIWQTEPQTIGHNKATSSDPSQQHLERLHDALTTGLSLEDLKILCFRLGVDFDELGSGGKPARILDLLTSLKRKGRLSDLQTLLTERYPYIESDPANRLGTGPELRTALEIPSRETTALRASNVNATLLDPAQLDNIRRAFATYMGPMARILVDRMAKRAHTLDELYALLAAEISSAPDRSKFLASRKS